MRSGHTAGTRHFSKFLFANFHLQYHCFTSIKNNIYLSRSFFRRGPFPYMQFHSVRLYEGNGLWSTGRSVQPGGNNLCGGSALWSAVQRRPTNLHREPFNEKLPINFKSMGSNSRVPQLRPMTANGSGYSSTLHNKRGQSLLNWR